MAEPIQISKRLKDQVEKLKKLMKATTKISSEKTGKQSSSQPQK